MESDDLNTIGIFCRRCGREGYVKIFDDNGCRIEKELVGVSFGFRLTDTPYNEDSSIPAKCRECGEMVE